MDEYKELAAAVMGLPLDTDEDEIESQLFDRFGVDLGSWTEIVDGLLPWTPCFPSLLVPGEMIQAIIRPTDDGKAAQAFVRWIIPPPKE